MEPGSHLGPYEIVSRIGAGGMGEVWRARDTRLGRDVAIKILPAEFAQDARLKIRFEREARAIAHLTHPNICTLFDVGENYLVMELLVGESLATRLARGPLSMPEVVRYGAELAEALGQAHRQGVVHRDVKPGNVMITKAGAKLLDFGLAKSTRVEAASRDDTVQKPVTEQGAVVGTFQYMAPEQLAGEEPDARTDIFALGAVLYEMATGKRAFEGETRTSLVSAIVSGEPRTIRELQPLTPPMLEHIILKCLEKERDDRLQNASDIAEELRWISQSGSQTGVAQRITVHRKMREGIAWSVAALMTVAAIALTLLRIPPAEPLPMRLAFLAPPGTTGPAVISPDGSRITFAAPSSSGTQVLWVRSLDSDAAYPLAGTEGAAAPFWSADSRRIAFFADEKLKRIDATGGSLLTICDAPRPGSGSWNERDEIIFAAAALGPLHRVAATGGVPKPLYDLDNGRGERAQTSPFFLPDGEHFVFTSSTSSNVDIFFGSLTDASTKLLARRSSGSRVAYTNGLLVYDRGNSLVAQRFDASRGEVGGEPITITDQGGGSFSVSAAGTLIFRPPALQQLVWLDRSGQQIGTIDGTGRTFMVGDPAAFRSQLSLSPDDTQAAIVLFEGDSSDIWIVDLVRGARTRFTLDPRADDAEPAWSPDGTQIAFSSNRNGAFDIYAKSVSGESGERLLFKSGRNKYVKNWSRDGRFISFIDLSSSGTTAAGNPRTDPWILPVADPPTAFPYLTTDTFEDTNLFSFDGRWMAYISDETGQWELFVSTFPKSSAKWQISRQPLPSFPEAFRWRRDGKEILYLTRDWTVMAVPVSTKEAFTAGEPKALFNIGPSPAWDVTADGERFLVAKPVSTTDEVRFTVLTNWSSQFER